MTGKCHAYFDDALKHHPQAGYDFDASFVCFPKGKLYALCQYKNVVATKANSSSGSRGGGPGGSAPLDPKFEAPDYILRPKLHLLTHK